MLKHLALTLLAFAATLPAQTITPDTPVTSAQLVQWLHSGDPRLIAWSATLAVRHHDLAPVIQMPALLQTSNLLQSTNTRSLQGLAVQAILDALIQEQTPVTLPAINAIAPHYPAQAAILIKRLPLTESQSTLLDWTHNLSKDWNVQRLARIAAMMLADAPHPDPTFVAEIVAAAEEDLHITIGAKADAYTGIRPPRPCGDVLGGLPRNWPEVFDYDLTEDDTYNGAILLLELSGDRITYRRLPASQGYGSCNAVDPLFSVNRHHLIAHWLGVNPRQMPWQPIEYITIAWKDEPDYQQQLKTILATHHAQLAATFDTLYRRGLLQPSPMTPISGDQVLPHLNVTIQCDLNPCPIDIK